MPRKRRASGEGSCRWIESRQRWEIQLPPDGSGKTPPRRYFVLERDALAALRQMRQERDKGMDHRRKDVPIGVYLQTWLDDVKRRALQPRTYETYGDHIRRLAPIGKIKIKSITALQLQAAFNTLLDTYSIGVVHGIKTMLVSALDYAVNDLHILVANPARSIKLPPLPRQIPRAMDADQVQSFLAACEGHRLEVLFITALWLGLRRGELCGLLWADVDLDDRTLTVKASTQRINGKLVRGKTKNESSDRVLPLDDELIAILRAHKVRQMRDRLRLGWTDNGHVFINMRGKPCEPGNVGDAFKGLLAAAGLPLTFRLHDMRHTAISHMLANGARLKDVSAIAGHQNATTTANIYAHSFDEGKRAAVEAMRSVVRRKAK
jgi:integrase